MLKQTEPNGEGSFVQKSLSHNAGCSGSGVSGCLRPEPGGRAAGAQRHPVFDQDTVAPGGQVVVTIAAAGYGSLGAVTETLPAGFSYVSSSLTEEGEVTKVDDRTVRFTLQGADKTFTYTVTASDTARRYDFSGKLRDADRADHDVGGARTPMLHHSP